ncbi:hypothetical protein SAMN06266787_11119 [Halorubrum ezzemoulense]|uniref:Uncharacterized protein n=1 Tax=Halorubrum ezzemoulense TaxID=337243 RepID=A0A238YES6_HALEZ|nr:hypothetical protein SAMN06266787_11119 [Halorubrum ezzemoulense]
MRFWWSIPYSSIGALQRAVQLGSVVSQSGGPGRITGCCLRGLKSRIGRSCLSMRCIGIESILASSIDPNSSASSNQYIPTTALPISQRSSKDSSSILRRSSVDPPSILRRSSVDPPSILRRSSVDPPSILRRSSVDPPSILQQSSVDPPAILQRFSVDPPSILQRFSVDPPAILQRSSSNPPAIFRRSSNGPVAIFTQTARTLDANFRHTSRNLTEIRCSLLTSPVQLTLPRQQHAPEAPQLPEATVRSAHRLRLDRSYTTLNAQTTAHNESPRGDMTSPYCGQTRARSEPT